LFCSWGLIARSGQLPLLVLFVGVIGGLMAWGFTGMFIGATTLAILWGVHQTWLGARDDRSGAALNVLAHSNWSTGFRPRSRRAAIAIAGWSLQRTIPLHWQLGVMAEVIGCLSEDDVSHESRALD
jgi:hypothetical protein